jgi:hypothetical protein
LDFFSNLTDVHVVAHCFSAFLSKMLVLLYFLSLNIHGKVD